MSHTFGTVRCELPRCEATTDRNRAVPVSIVFDGRRLRGLTCSPEHAAELRRGWSDRDAFGPEFAHERHPGWARLSAAVAEVSA